MKGPGASIWQRCHGVASREVVLECCRAPHLNSTAVRSLITTNAGPVRALERKLYSIAVTKPSAGITSAEHGMGSRQVLDYFVSSDYLLEQEQT